MCWNEDISLNTFLFSSFVLCLIIYNNTYTPYKIPCLNFHTYVFLSLVIIVQLLEFFLWRNINNPIYNKFLTYCIAFVISMQPIASLFIIQNNTYLRNILIIIYIIFSFISTFRILFIKKKDIKSLVSPNGNMVWDLYSNSSIYTVNTMIWLFFFFFSFAYNRYYFLLFFGIITFLYSFIKYNTYNEGESVWCWLINSIFIYYAAVLLIYLPFFDKSKIGIKRCF